MIDFAPKPASSERLCAGVVTRTDDGVVEYRCAVDGRKIGHAFGSIGAALHDVSEKLCQSLAHHWRHGLDPEEWIPPFNLARLASLERFSARDSEEGAARMLSRNSTLYTLLDAYEVQQSPRSTSIVERVRAVIRRDTNTRHLAKRFNRELILNGEAQPFRVDFLGQRYACYFLQVTQSERGLESNIERAYGKLFELQALKGLVKEPKKVVGLLEEERPEIFELLMVGDRNDPIQRKAIYQVEALADRGEVVARIESSANAAAERVTAKERLAA